MVIQPDLRRYALRLTTSFFLLSAQRIRSILGLDIVGALLLVTISDANVRHMLSDEELRERYAGLDDIPPDQLRKPISVYALSRELGLPYETTRRQVNKLIEAGFCHRSESGGLVIPQSFYEREDMKQHTNANWDGLSGVVCDLLAAGADFRA